MDVRITDGSQDVVIGTREGMAIRFHEQEVRSMGRSAAGVRAINLEKNDRVIGAVALRRTGTTILIATELGYGKRSETEEYRVSHRGGKGIITVKTTDKTGNMVAIKEVVEKDDVVVVTSGGIVIRQHASEIRVAGRNTQGVRLIKLGDGDKISDVAVVVPEDEEPTNGDGAKGTGAQSRESGGAEQAHLFDNEKKTPVKKKEKTVKGAKVAPPKEIPKKPEPKKTPPVKKEAPVKQAKKPAAKPKAAPPKKGGKKK